MAKTKPTMERKKPAPVPTPGMMRCNVVLEEEFVEWGKHQPGGLCELLRHLLREAKAKAERQK